MRILIYLLLIFLTACSAKEDAQNLSNANSKLIIYNWEDYLAPGLIEDFEKESSIDVELQLFDDEERVISDLEKCSNCYDLIVVSDDLVMRLKRKYLLSVIDKGLLSNFKNIGQSFIDPVYDPNNDFSVPYLWGTTGIIVNKKYVNDYEQSWDLLWDKRYASKMAMLNNRDEVMGAALKRLGYSLNTTMPSELNEASDMLLEQRGLLKGYMDLMTIREELRNENLWLAHIYSGEAIAMIDDNENFEYFIPYQGAPRWVDNMVIPKDAKNKLAAHKFIDYVLDAQNSARIANYQWYANANVRAREFTNPEILNSKVVYPDEKVLARCEYFEPARDQHALLLTNRLREKIWDNLNKVESN